MSCKASYCRFPQSHVTKEHVCGICNNKGHGQVECNNSQLKENLKKFYNEILPIDKQCTIPNCHSKTNHNNDGHHCINCGRRHPESECIIQSIDTHCSRFGLDQSNIIQFLHNPINTNTYIYIYIGMGCYLYIRSDMKSLFMHQDSHGQYGPSSDDTPILNTFLENYSDKTEDYNLADANDANDANEYSIECPFCRTLNNSKEIMEIKGSNSNCIICDEENIEIYLSKCKHSHICSKCCNKLEKLI
jgi:hypothetical protein